ncbi:MAG: hypothetical protein Q9170_005059 [Blastenia crenularia]
MADEEEEKQFQQLWTDAKIRFEKKTKRSLEQSKISTLGQAQTASLDDVLKGLDESKDGHDAKKGEKHQRFKTAAFNVLNFISLLGGIAAEGASVVFGPANLCFNAMQCLINIPSKISSFYEDLTRLFDAMSTSLKQVKIYQRVEDFDVELKRCSHKLMILFVDICAISIYVLDSSFLQKIKIGAKIALLDDDSGIQDMLRDLRTLVGQQSQISDAITLEHVLKSEQLTESMKRSLDTLKKNSEDSGNKLEASLNDVHDNVTTIKTGQDILIQAADAQKDKEKHREQYEQICKKLSVPSDTFSKAEKAFDQAVKYNISSTGSWLDSIDVYKPWADVGSGLVPRLALIGESGTGKSSLAFSVLEKLKCRYDSRSGSPMRVKLASYRFMKSDRPNRDDYLKLSIRWMAAQIAYQDIVYSKHLHSHLESKDTNYIKGLTIRELAHGLLPPPNMSGTADIAYLLLFDGLDQLKEGEPSQLLDATLAINSSRIRTLLTGTKEVFSGQVLGSILVTEYNETDLKQFIDATVTNLGMLQGDGEKASRILNKIRDKLPRTCEGNFENARRILKTINEAVESDEPEDQITRLISIHALPDKAAAIRQTLGELENSLNEREISQLNELLIWTIYAYEYMSVDQMRAALFLLTREIPLQSLETKIEGKYSKLLKIEPDNAQHTGNALEMRNADLEDFFSASLRERLDHESNASHDAKISLTIKIDLATTSQIQRFLWDLSEKTTLDKFLFASSPTGPEPSVKIGANTTDGDLTLTRRCFEILQDDPLDETKVLGEYALKSFFEFAYLLGDEFEIPAIYAWLKDADAANGLKPKGRRWLKNVLSAQSPLALKGIALMVANHWLCQRKWPADLPFRWLDTFLDRIHESQEQRRQFQDQSDERNSEDILNEDDSSEVTDITAQKESLSSSERVQRAIEWVQTEENLTKNSTWYERLGNTYLEYELYDASADTFEEGKKLQDFSWRISEGLAEVYAKTNRMALAVDEMQKVVACLQGTKGISTGEDDDLIRNLVKAAKWQIELEMMDDAVSTMREVIDYNEYQYQQHAQLLKLLVDTERVPEALELLNELMTHPAKNARLTRLEALFLDFADYGMNLETLEGVFDAFQHGDGSYEIARPFENAISFARENQPGCLPFILLYYGVALTHYITKPVRAVDLGVNQGIDSPTTESLASNSRVRDSKEENKYEFGLVYWQESYKLSLPSPHTDWYVLDWAACYIFKSHFSAIKIAQGANNDLDDRVAEIRNLADCMSNPSSAFELRLSLGKLYVSTQRQDAAQDLLLNDMKDAFAILSDDDPSNDLAGFLMMAYILSHIGDDLNALSAWSLYGPGDRYDNEELIYDVGCNGRCKKPIAFADSLWFCKVCDVTQFHDECLDKFRNGTQRRFVCSPDHEWLHVPSCLDEYEVTGKGRVRTGGTLQDGKRVGGHIVPVVEWLDTIRTKWGIEKAKPDATTEDLEQEDNEKPGRSTSES